MESLKKRKVGRGSLAPKMTDANDAAVDWRTKYEQLKHEHALLRELQDEHEKTEAFLEEALRNTEQEADQREKELQQAQERVQQLEEALTSANVRPFSLAALAWIFFFSSRFGRFFVFLRFSPPPRTLGTFSTTFSPLSTLL